MTVKSGEKEQQHNIEDVNIKKVAFSFFILQSFTYSVFHGLE